MDEYSKNKEHTIEDIADIVDTVLSRLPLSEVLERLTDKILALFSEHENMSVKISWLDKEHEYSSNNEKNIFFSGDITLNGKKKGTIEVTIEDTNAEIKNDTDQIRNYENLMRLVSRIISTSLEKRIEVTELKYLDEKIRDYCDKLDDHIFIVDSDGNILDFNKSFEDCIGYTAEKLHQMNIRDIPSLCSDGFDGFSLIEDASANGSATITFDNKCKNGEVRPMSLTCKLLENTFDTMFICIAKDISETLKTEFELQESEKKYSTIVEKGNDGIIIVQDGIIRFANPRILDITRCAHEDLINENYLKIIHPQDHEKCLEWFNKCNVNSANKGVFHIDLITKYNEEIPVEANGSMIDFEGRKAKLLIIRDISERKRNEELLKKEKDRLENYLDVVGSIIGIVDKESNIIFVNKKGAEVLGYPKDEIIGENWFEKFLPESVRAITRENYFRVINHEIDPPEYFENFILTKSGEERLIFWHDVPIENEKGERIGVISSGEDITESRKIESMLVESEKNLKTIFDHVDDQIFIYQPYGNFIDVNTAVISSSGYTREEMLAMSPKDIVKPELRPLMNCYTERIIKEKNLIFEICSIRKDGSLLPLEMNSGLIEYKGEQAILTVARDITERKKAEERLKRYANELKHSNELKDLFTDIIRHDLLTPASVVRGYTEELLFLIKDESALMMAEKVKENNDKLIELLDTATKLAKLQKEEDIDFENLDITSVFKMILDSFKDQIDSKKHELSFVEKGPCLAVVNPVIGEVFANMLSNAIKYSPPKSRIAIAFADDNDMWKVSVTDFGVGISDDDKPLLFNRFHRADKKGIKGTGLGLAIVKRIIELHGGKYGVEDNPTGQGSVFWITVKKA